MTRGRARSFGPVAGLYDRYRPAPPAELARELGAVEGLDVLDLAAGTGIVTRYLLARGARVSAVEPDDEMRAVLERQSPGVTALSGAAEAIPLGDSTFDLVVTSSAWHWFRQPDATQEIARVLRDGGRLAVLGNGFDRSHEWLEDLAALREPGDQSWSARRAHEAAADLEGPFDDVRTITIDWTWTRSIEQLVGLFHTYSGVITRPAPEKERLEALVREELERLAPNGSIDVPMTLRGVLATRRPR